MVSLPLILVITLPVPVPIYKLRERGGGGGGEHSLYVYDTFGELISKWLIYFTVTLQYEICAKLHR